MGEKQKALKTVPKTLVIGRAEKRSISGCQKPRSKLKHLLKVFGCLATADIHGSCSIGYIGLIPGLMYQTHQQHTL